MEQMTKEQFVEEIQALNKDGKTFNVESSDSGTMYLALYGCKIDIAMEDGIEGEITIFKPSATMEARIDFDIVENISKGEKVYDIEFNNGMSSMTITAIS